MITTPEIICDLFSFLNKDQIERIQLVNQFWNNVIIRHKNILPLRQFKRLHCYQNQIHLYATEDDHYEYLDSYKIQFDGTKLIKGNVSSRYSQLTFDEVLTNLNDVVFSSIIISNCVSDDCLDDLLNLIKLVTTKTGGGFRGRYGSAERSGSKLNEIFDNYIIVDHLAIRYWYNDLYIREVCANPEIVQLPSTPKKIYLSHLEFEDNEEVLNFTSKLNGANRLTIGVETSETNYGNFIRQWFELYRTHENPISLVGKFNFVINDYLYYFIFDAVKTFLSNNQLRVKYSLETKEIHHPNSSNQYQYLRRCVIHETDSYALVIEMEYMKTDISSINASDLDQPPCNEIDSISCCVKSL